MAARKLKPKVAPLEVPQEDWIWGNHRGGGGAPLKDNDGNSVANLKKVIAGEVEVDHSPSPKAKRKPLKFRPDEYDDDDNYNQYSNKNNRDDRSDNYRNRDDYSNNSNSNKGRGRNYAPDEVVYTPPKKTGYGSFTNAANNISDYDREIKMRKEMEYQDALKKQIEEKNRLKAAEKAEAERIKAAELEEYLQTQYKGKVPSHLNNKAKGNDTSDERDRRNAAVAAGQGKKKGFHEEDEDYGNGNNGGARKNRVPKFKDDYQDDDEGSVGRGPRNQRKFRDDPEEDDYNYDGNRKGGRNNGNNRNNNRNNDYQEEEEDLSARNYNKKHASGGSNRNSYGGGGNRRRGDESDPEEDYDQPPRRGAAGGRRSDGGGVRGSKENMVPLREYDELSKLCDKLMDQQDAMHNEIKAQAKLIEELRKKDAHAGVGAAAGRGGAVKSSVASRAAAKNVPPMSPRGAYEGFNGGRSKSVQQQRVGAGAAAAKKGESEKASAMKRPSSMHTIAARDKQAIVDIPPPLGKPKVAFGGAAAGPAAPMKGLKKTLASAAANSVVKSSGPDRYAKIKTSPTKVAQAQEMNGFARLQNNYKGPVVVTHEEEDEPPRGGRRDWGNDEEPVGAANRKKGPAMKQSLELKGKSEYIRVSTEDDMINGDQLDRLLIQARKARVG